MARGSAQIACAISLLLAIGPAGFALVLFSPGFLRILAVAVCISVVAVIARRARKVSLVADPEGVTICNFWRAPQVISWQDLKAVRIGRLGWQSAVVFALRDGHVRPAQITAYSQGARAAALAIVRTYAPEGVAVTEFPL